jgi:hypothetical protein
LQIRVLQIRVLQIRGLQIGAATAAEPTLKIRTRTDH